MTDFIEDLFAFLSVTDEPVTCSRCGRQLAEGEQYTLDEDTGGMLGLWRGISQRNPLTKMSGFGRVCQRELKERYPSPDEL